MWFLIIENWNLTFHPLGNGTIELSEFVTMMHQKQAIIRGIDIDNEDDMREYFKVLSIFPSNFYSLLRLLLSIWFYKERIRFSTKTETV